jgi:hypothetical protein
LYSNEKYWLMESGKIDFSIPNPNHNTHTKFRRVFDVILTSGVSKEDGESRNVVKIETLV